MQPPKMPHTTNGNHVRSLFGGQYCGQIFGRSRSVKSIRNYLVDAPRSLGGRARAERWELFLGLFLEIQEMTVIDLGGTTESWLRAPVRPRHVTVVNLFEPGSADESWLAAIEGDACSARKALDRASQPTSVDLVFSNSLIEHVGGHAKRQELADQVHSLAPFHWVQTPYRYFPIEPHWLFPGMQFLPTSTAAWVALRWPLAHTLPATRADAVTEVMWTELVSITQMRAYFPSSSIHRERLAGLTKSVCAVAAPA